MQFYEYDIFILLTVLIIGCKISFTKASQEESDLYMDLLKDYYPYERPVEHASDNVTVYVGLILQQIVDVVSSRRFFNFFQGCC